MRSFPSTQYIRQFHDHGFVLVPSLFSPGEVREISQGLNRLQEIAKDLKSTCVKNGTQFVLDNHRIQRIVWVAAAEPALKKLGTDRRITALVGQLLGSDTMDHLICQAHYKLPGDEVSFAWHQDAEHRGYGTPDWTDVNGRGSYVQTITAVDAMTLDNGPLMILPGSHKDGFLGLNRPDGVREKLIPVEQLIPLSMEPGSVLFFGPYLVHGSHPNQSGVPRRIFINGFACPGANRRVYPGEGSGYRFRLAD